MTARVWKFPLEVTDEQYVLMPQGAVLLHVGRQGPHICLWALCTDAPPRRRALFIYGTGHDVPDGHGDYVASLVDGPFVWHVFDGGEL